MKSTVTMLYSFDSFSDTRLNVFDVQTDHRSPLLLKLECERSFELLLNGRRRRRRRSDSDIIHPLTVVVIIRT